VKLSVGGPKRNFRKFNIKQHTPGLQDDNGENVVAHGKKTKERIRGEK
jgi:hypothetical protein